MLMQTEFPEELLETELPLKRFGLRPQSVLQRLGIRTIGMFLRADWDSIQCWQLGEKARAELKAQHTEMGESADTVRAWLQAAPHQDSLLDGSPSVASSFSVPTELKDAPLVLSSFSTRASGVLERASILTFQAFLQTDFDTLQARGMGVKARTELQEKQQQQREWVTEALTDANPSQQLEKLRDRLLRAVAADAPTLPASEDVKWLREDVLDLPNIWPSTVRAIVGRDERHYDVLARRFNLDNRGEYTLDKLRLAMGVSRERVRQIERDAIKKLRNFLMEGALHGYKEKAHSTLQTEIESFNEALREVGFPLPNAGLWDILEERYGTAPSEAQRPFFVLLLEVLGLERFRAQRPQVPRDLDLAWLDDADDKSLIVTIANATLRTLRARATPLPLFDLLIESNRILTKDGQKTDAVTLRRVLSLCPSLEKVAEDVYQVRFEELSSVVLRAERIMLDWVANEKLTATIGEIAQELNHRNALAGQEANATNAAVGGACGRSTAIVNIANSGEWALKENAGETRNLHELIEEALLIINRPSTADEIAAYVNSRREAAPNSIPALLQQHRKFQRVGRGLYALRSWGMEDATPAKRGAEYQEEFDDTLLEIFLDNDVQPIRQAQLIRQLCEKLGWKENTVRQRLDNSPWLDTTSLEGNRLLSHWRDEPKVELDTLKRQTKRGRIQDAARRLLKSAPERQMAGATLSALLERETGAVRAVIYNSLAAMPDVERQGEPRNMVYRLQTHNGSTPVAER
jgi:hypothetical protein